MWRHRLQAASFDTDVKSERTGTTCSVRRKSIPPHPPLCPYPTTKSPPPNYRSTIQQQSTFDLAFGFWDKDTDPTGSWRVWRYRLQAASFDRDVKSELTRTYLQRPPEVDTATPAFMPQLAKSSQKTPPQNQKRPPPAQAEDGRSKSDSVKPSEKPSP